MQLAAAEDDNIQRGARGREGGGEGGREVGGFIVNEECPARRTLPSVVVSPASGAVFFCFWPIVCSENEFFGDF